MIKPRAGLLAFNESLVREDVYKKRKPIADREVQRFLQCHATRFDSRQYVRYDDLYKTIRSRMLGREYGNAKVEVTAYRIHRE